MIIKNLIVILFIGNVAALGVAFYWLMVDQGQKSKRTANWLFVRVALAIALIVVVAIGIWTGDLAISSPWYNPA